MRNKQKQLLIELRSQLVGVNQTLPFTIYTDQTIEDLLDAQPKSMEELVRVKGFPKEGKRVKGFGEAIVAIFTKCNSIKSFSVAVSDGNASVGTQLRPVKAF